MRLLTAIKLFYPARLWYATDILFKAYWGESKEIDNNTTLTSVLIESGEFSESIAGDLIRRTSESVIKNSLREATEASVELGLFGAPTFAIHRDTFSRREVLNLMEHEPPSVYELFFGADRIPLMAHCLGLPWVGPLSKLQQQSSSSSKL
nr:glutathione S-transferase kappa 1 [Cardiosporidium cionae]